MEENSNRSQLINPYTVNERRRRHVEKVEKITMLIDAYRNFLVKQEQVEVEEAKTQQPQAQASLQPNACQAPKPKCREGMQRMQEEAMKRELEEEEMKNELENEDGSRKEEEEEAGNSETEQEIQEYKASGRIEAYNKNQAYWNRKQAEW